MGHDGNQAEEAWERALREGLDGLAGPVDRESPPDLGALLLLVGDVQRAQRQALQRDLLRFLAAAALIVAAGLWALARFPLYYLAAQGAMAVALAAGAALWQADGRRARHE